jgi:excisionase family DNA binding protein
VSAPATVIEPSDAGRCAALLQAGIKALARNGHDFGDLEQIQATLLVAYQSGQTLTLEPVSITLGLHVVKPADDGEDDLLNLTEAARQAGISRPTLYKRIDRGELCPVIRGGHRFIRRQDLSRGFR